MRILLPFCRAVPERCFYQEFHSGMAEALRELGHEAIQFSFAQTGSPTQQEAGALLQTIDTHNCGAVFDLACWSYGLSGVTLSMLDGSKKLIYDAFDLACVGMLWDHPHNQNIEAVRARKLFAAYPDRGHAQQISLTCPDLALAGEVFFPPAIRPGSDYSAAKDAPERDIDVLYLGNLDTFALERFWNDRISPLWQESYDIRFCDALTEIALEAPERSLHLSVARAIADAGPPAPGYLVGQQLRAVEHHLRHLFRHRAVMALAASGVRLHLVGKGWNVATLPQNVDLEGETIYDGMFQLAARAKICLDASTYLDGANDRVFSYSLNGALCLTNASGYLREAFGKGEIAFYSMRDLNGLGEQVKTLLAQPAALREAGQRARQTVLASHTWRTRMDDLLRASGAQR